MYTRTERRCTRAHGGAHAELSWQQMASLNLHPEELDDQPQQRETREMRLLDSLVTPGLRRGEGRPGALPIGHLFLRNVRYVYRGPQHDNIA